MTTLSVSYGFTDQFRMMADYQSTGWSSLHDVTIKRANGTVVGAEDFMLRLRELAAVDVLKSYRQQAERLRDDELAKAQRLLANGSSAEEVLLQLARGLTNKLLHAPSVQLKKMSAAGRLDALAMAQELFALNEGADKNSQ